MYLTPPMVRVSLLLQLLIWIMAGSAHGSVDRITSREPGGNNRQKTQRKPNVVFIMADDLGEFYILLPLDSSVGE